VLSTLVVWLSRPGTSSAPQPSTSSPTELVCGVTALAGDDLAVCAPGGIVQLNGSFFGDALGFQWEPSAPLDDPTSLQPFATVFGETTFTLTVTGFDPDSPNLATNGDFGQGTNGFISNYTFVADQPSGNMEVYGEGLYSITGNPIDVHPNFASCSDHGGNNAMMVVNGASNVTNIWCQQINVTPNTDYNFSAWVATVVGVDPTQLQFTVNGQQVGQPFQASNATCAWEQFSGNWNSGSDFTATLCILNLSTALNGNDFALDDIRFSESCTSTDEVTVEVIDVVTTIDGPDSLSCNSAGSCTTLQASVAGVSESVTFQWFSGDGGTIVSGGNTASPEICGAGTYNVLVRRRINGTTCTDLRTYSIPSDDAAPPAPSILGPTDFCPGEEAFAVLSDSAYAAYACLYQRVLP